ncbi:MAG: hypothetical protein HY952_01740 [Elusimicrobia bacterium]|nr:hypothetical protein [Elusimicrobiota bacterium]
MNDNLPDINFKEKKEKKKGALGWLRSRLGLGSRGAMGEAGINPSAMNLGRAAMGAGKFGASNGILGLLAGKASILATIAAVAVASGVYLANQAPAPTGSNSSFSGGRVQDNYVPAILRSQAANQGSSLDMFKDTNKGAGLSMEEDPSKKAAKPADDKPAPAEEAAAQDQPAPDQGNMAQAMMGKLQGGEVGSLTSSMGGGSNKFSGMGGFSNKFNQGQMGAKTGFSAGIGSGFQGMPKFDARKGKMTAMKGSARPLFSGAGAGKKGKFGAGAFGQAKGLRATQRSYSGSSADQMAGTQNAAWSGATPDGSATGGSGLSDGGAGIMSSPSLDNAGGANGGGGAGNPNPVVPDVGGPVDVSPWTALLTKALLLLTISLILSAIASYLCSIKVPPWVYWVGIVVAVIAMGLAAMVMSAGSQLGSSFGQKAMGNMYMVAGGAAIAAAGIAMAGNAALNGWQMVMSAVAGIAVMIGSMLGGK